MVDITAHDMVGKILTDSHIVIVQQIFVVHCPVCAIWLHFTTSLLNHGGTNQRGKKC